MWIRPERCPLCTQILLKLDFVSPSFIYSLIHRPFMNMVRVSDKQHVRKKQASCRHLLVVRVYTGIKNNLPTNTHSKRIFPAYITAKASWQQKEQDGRLSLWSIRSPNTARQIWGGGLIYTAGVEVNALGPQTQRVIKGPDWSGRAGQSHTLHLSADLWLPGHTSLIFYLFKSDISTFEFTFMWILSRDVKYKMSGWYNHLDIIMRFIRREKTLNISLWHLLLLHSYNKGSVGFKTQL